jgi:hypothetical protein
MKRYRDWSISSADVLDVLFMLTLIFVVLGIWRVAS